MPNPSTAAAAIAAADAAPGGAAGAALSAPALTAKVTTCDELDEGLFEPPPPKVECHLCFLPLPDDPGQTHYHNCCGEIICFGCNLKYGAVLFWSNLKRAAKDPPDPPLERKCAFCREPFVLKGEEKLQRYQKRMAADDARAFNIMAEYHRKFGLSKDEGRAEELFLRAVELGSADACFSLAYGYGLPFKDVALSQVRSQDRLKMLHYLRLGAKRGQVRARFALGGLEGHQHNFELAVKHYMISAAAGHDDSLKRIGTEYRKKRATKDQFEEAIRANHKAKKEMSSFERKMAKKATVDGGGFDFTLLSPDDFIALCGIRKREDMVWVRQWWNKDIRRENGGVQVKMSRYGRCFGEISVD